MRWLNAGLILSHLKKEYCFKLNSPDVHDPDLPLHQSKAHGGTLVMWKRDLQPFISICPSTSSSFLPLIFHPPQTTPLHPFTLVFTFQQVDVSRNLSVTCLAYLESLILFVTIILMLPFISVEILTLATGMLGGRRSLPVSWKANAW